MSKSKTRQKTKRLESGGKIKWKYQNNDPSDTSEYECYDKAGNYLGFCADMDEALHMAAHGYVNVAHLENGSCELDLWELWNTIKWHEGRVLVSSDGQQIQALHDMQHFLVAEHDEKYGYSVKLIDEVELYDTFGSNEHESTLELTVCPEQNVMRCE